MARVKVSGCAYGSQRHEFQKACGLELVWPPSGAVNCGHCLRVVACRLIFFLSRSLNQRLLAYLTSTRTAPALEVTGAPLRKADVVCSTAISIDQLMKSSEAGATN